jgi:glycerophosphoryl diester phosphodiesterase
MKSRGDGDRRLAGALAGLLARRSDAGRIVVSSFDWPLLRAFRRVAPAVAVGLLFEPSTAWRLRVAAGIALVHPSAVHPERRLVSAARAMGWTRRGLATNVWTVDAPEEAERLCALGAAAIVTNVPGRIREVVRRATGR